MRILFDHHEPFLLAHGGMEILVHETMNALQRAGLEVEPLRWWDRNQTGDIIHFFGRPSLAHIRFAHGKGIKYVFHELLTAQGSRSRTSLLIQSLLQRIASRLSRGITEKFGWRCYQEADAVIASTEWEKQLMLSLYGAKPETLHVVPTGVAQAFFDAGRTRLPPAPDAPLVCVATITERKGILPLIEAAMIAKVRLDVIGKPYSGNDPYFQKCRNAASESRGLIRLRGPVEDPADLARELAEAKAFVLFSRMETESTVALAAAAVGLPLVLSDLPWARCVFGDQAIFVESNSLAELVAAIESVAQKHENMLVPSPPVRWENVACQLLKIYSNL